MEYAEFTTLFLSGRKYSISPQILRKKIRDQLVDLVRSEEFPFESKRAPDRFEEFACAVEQETGETIGSKGASLLEGTYSRGLTNWSSSVARSDGIRFPFILAIWYCFQKFNLDNHARAIDLALLGQPLGKLLVACRSFEEILAYLKPDAEIADIENLSLSDNASRQSPKVARGKKSRSEVSYPVSTRPARIRFSAKQLPRASGGFFGRDIELQHMIKVAEQKVTNIVTVVAPGGYGKTTLVENFIAKVVGEERPRFESVFEWSFYSQGFALGTASSDQFFEAAYSFFNLNLPRGSSADRASPLARHLARHCVLLVLDGLEPLQSPPGNSGGSIRDNDLRLLLRMLGMNNAGLCVVTTRIHVVDLDGYRGKSLSCVGLKGLDEKGAIEMLLSQHVEARREELRDVVASVECNPLALRLLGGYFSHRNSGSIAGWQQVVLIEESRSAGDQVRSILRRYHDWLEPNEVQVLKMLGFFRSPATMKEVHCLQQVIGGRVAGTSTAKDDFIVSANRLAAVGLIHGSLRDGFLDCHPIVREFERQESREDQSVWDAGHRALAELLESSVSSIPKSSTEFFILYDAIAHRVDAGMHQYAWDRTVVPRIWQGDNVSTNQFGLLGAELATLRSFFDHPYEAVSQKLTEEAKAQLLSQTAFLLSSTNQLADSVTIQTENFRRRVALKNWDEATIASGSAAEYCLILGDLTQATSLISKSLKVARKLASPRWALAAHSMAGVIRYEHGFEAKCSWHFEQAMNIFQSSRLDGEAFLGRASGFNMLWTELDQIDFKFWNSLAHGKSVPKKVLKKLSQVLAWATWCAQANHDSDESVPIYHSWFNLLILRCWSLQSLFLGSQLEDCEEKLESCERAILTSGVVRYLPLVQVVRLDMSVARAFLGNSTEFNDKLEIQEIPSERDGSFLRYEMMLALRRSRLKAMSGNTIENDKAFGKAIMKLAKHAAIYEFRQTMKSFDCLLELKKKIDEGMDICGASRIG